jgi:hypothetical protein
MHRHRGSKVVREFCQFFKAKVGAFPFSTKVLFFAALSLTSLNLFLCCTGDPIDPGPFPQPYDDFPSVSADGGRVAFRSTGASRNGPGIYMVDTSGNSLDFFVPGGYEPEWGPGDSILYFTSQFDDHLRILNLSSGSETVVSDSTEDRRANFNALTKVVYFDRYNRHTAPYHDIYALDFTTNQLTNLVRGEAPWAVGNPAQIAFEWWIYPTPTTYVDAIFVLNVVDMSIDTLPMRSDYLNEPVLSPSGQVVYYEEMKSGLAPKIMEFDRPTGRVTKLVENAREPHLDNEGGVLYFVAPDAGDVERIWKLDIETNGRTQLTF